MSRNITDSLAIVWEGPFATNHSFPLINRAICQRLLQRGHRLSLRLAGLDESNITPLTDHPALAEHVGRTLPDDSMQVSHRWPPRLQRPAAQVWAWMQPWEFGSLPVAWLHAMNEQADAVWVYSTYLRDCYLRSGVHANLLHVVPPGVDPARFRPDAPPRTLTNRKGFRFLFVGGTIPRKGIDVLLDAYRHAFTAADDVCLVLKDFGTRSFYQGQTAQERFARWRDDPDAPEIEYLDGDWPDDELPSLYTACDCLVAPYRGEGFGLPIAEALACGRSAIVTGHGAALDFCSADNAYLIPAREVFLPQPRIGDLETVGQPWLAEPDRDALIELLRHVASHAEEARGKGQSGAALIREHFTWDHTARRVEELLTAMARQPACRSAQPAASVCVNPSHVAERPRVSLTMIVKDGTATLEKCLTSVRDLVDEIIIVDTGSADSTKDLARQHGGRIIDFAWCDSFAAARNESIRHATGAWVLWLDADEYFNEDNRAKLRNLLAGLGDDNTAYAMQQRSSSPNGSATLVDQVRLFRNHPSIRWDYRVHEQILPSLRRAGHDVRSTGIGVEHSGYLDPALRHKKLERNLRLIHMDLAERPNDPFTLFNLGWAFADLGRCAEAVPLLQQSLQHSHNADSITPKLYSLLTMCHRRLGQYADAWAACQAGIARCPDDAELLFLKGQLCHQRGERAAARTCWMQVLQPRSMPAAAHSADGVFASVDAGLRGPLVRYHLAVLDREEGRLADAEQHWQTILEQTPDYHPARIGLAELYLRQERWPEMETILGELEAHAPSDTAVLRARMFLARRELAAAQQLLEAVLRQAPQLLTAHVILSHVLLQSGNENAAEPLLRRIVELDPSQFESWRNLAVLYRRQHRLPEAIAAAQSGRVHCPLDADLLLLYGVLLHEGGDRINAETLLLSVLEIDGDGPARQRRIAARHHLILLYRSLGRQREADAHLRALTNELAEQAPVSTATDSPAPQLGNGRLHSGCVS